jgi:hypothetical protein
MGKHVHILAQFGQEETVAPRELRWRGADRRPITSVGPAALPAIREDSARGTCFAAIAVSSSAGVRVGNCLLALPAVLLSWFMKPSFQSWRYGVRRSRRRASSLA